MRIFVDLDGVTVDLGKGIRGLFNIQDPYLSEKYRGNCHMHKILGLSIDEFFKPMDTKFWKNLEFTIDGKWILSLVEHLFGSKNVCLLTNHSCRPEVAAGKVLWVEKNLPKYTERLLIGVPKHFCAGPDTMLIDDSDDNVEQFRKFGGVGVLIPRPWNSDYMLVGRQEIVEHRIRYAYLCM
jgi:hypothetical protein